MARMTFKAGDEYALKLSRLLTNQQEIAEKAIYAATNIVANQMRKNLEGVLSSEATGELIDSFGVTPIEKDRDGDWNVKIGFDGYDSKGVPNQLKARVLDSGSSKQKKTGFARKAVSATKREAKEKMAEIINQETEKVMK